MPAVPNWSAPTQFDLTNPFNGMMSFNVQTSDGLYLLDQSGCSFNINVRSTTDNVPQADGSILHHRFLTGTTVALTIQLWDEWTQQPDGQWEGKPDGKPACNALLAEMLDNLSGALRSLKNAGDNEGRLAWEIEGGNERMLDDVRLLVYPTFQMDTLGVVTVTLDSQFPYAQDLDQTRTPCEDGVPVTLTNTGSAEYYPVFLVNMLNDVINPLSVHDFVITVTHLVGTMPETIAQFVYSDAFPGADPISAGGHYAEINTFLNTIFLDGDGANLKAGVDELNSEYPLFPTGTFEVEIEGADCDILWAPAYA